MGFFSSSKKTTFPWIQLTSMDQLQTVLSSTGEKPVVLFKHSTRCSISAMALNRFQNEWNQEIDSADLYFLDLLNHRDLSNEIASLTGIVHQSPQVVVLKNNEIIYDDSHSAISAKKIQLLLSK